MSRPFAARFGGPCANDCGEPIRYDDIVQYDEDDELRHVHCTTRTPLRESPVCPSCWTAHAGECL